MNEPILSYTITSQAWYGGNVVKGDTRDEVMFGLYYSEGGTDGEAAFRWIDLGSQIACRLEAFDDSWRMLATVPDLLTRMAAATKNTDRTPNVDRVCEILRECGFIDRTPRSSPYADDPSEPGRQAAAAAVDNDPNHTAHPCHW